MCEFSVISFQFPLITGRQLWVVAIGHSAHEHVLLQPEVKLIGNIHGDEVRFHRRFQVPISN